MCGAEPEPKPSYHCIVYALGTTFHPLVKAANLFLLE